MKVCSVMNKTNKNPLLKFKKSAYESPRLEFTLKTTSSKFLSDPEHQ